MKLLITSIQKYKIVANLDKGKTISNYLFSINKLPRNRLDIDRRQ